MLTGEYLLKGGITENGGFMSDEIKVTVRVYRLEERAMNYAHRRCRGNTCTLSFCYLFNPFQILRDVFLREAQRSTCAIAGQSLTSNLTHHGRARDTATKLPDILNGVLRSLALQRRASFHLLLSLFHSAPV